MPFDINCMGKVSSSGNPKALNVWQYNGTASGSNEVLADLIAPNYFDPFMVKQTATAAYGPLQIGDMIFVHGTVSASIVRVATVAPNVTVVAY